ncbi:MULTISPECIES: ABC transporter substrate-binding protein [unclassified Beijerinckia]|uniref:ABC transporter substrate-binding protein n=1 Tax=unclassified Beijerinckia TaxID=2638183 RepID=UPI0008944427|nr:MULTISPECIES: ABC transporter substrate-binding protein [unclassified Beijerinckia]MDH7794044.1 sulfonate transport system substrate-binding protein [Beijerinckia sp. GAS462]SEB52074.1 sulfonate transport system substrate-binding protein [Beijerinckia sp. 28-YEA-48]
MPRFFRKSFGLAFIAAIVSIISVKAETLPSVIRLAGPGNAAGQPYGTNVLGVVRAKKVLEEEFKADGVNIEWQFPRGTGPAINEAFANGQLDFATYGSLPSIVGRGAGLRTKAIGSYGVAPVYVVARKDTPIAGIADLKDKKISLQRGTIFEWSLNRILSTTSLKERDLQIFDLQTADQVSAFTAGYIDAVVGNNTVLDLVDRGLGKVIYSTKGTRDPGTSFGVFTVSEDFAKKYPETTQRVVTAFTRAARFASDDANRNELYDIWALTGTPRAAFVKDYGGDDLRERLNPLLDEYFVSSVKDGVDFTLGAKLVRKGFKPEDWIDRSYLDKAIKQLGYEGFWSAYDANGKPAS